MTGFTGSAFVQPADFGKELQQYLDDKSVGEDSFVDLESRQI